MSRVVISRCPGRGLPWTWGRPWRGCRKLRFPPGFFPRHRPGPSLVASVTHGNVADPVFRLD